MWHKGEIALAEAAAGVGVPFCVSTNSITPIEEICFSSSQARLWVQIYVGTVTGQSRRSPAHWNARPAWARRHIVITVDMPVLPKREHNTRNGLVPLQPRIHTIVDVALHATWFFDVLCRYLVAGGMPCFEHYPGEYRTPITRPRKEQARLADNVTWDEIA